MLHITDTDERMYGSVQVAGLFLTITSDHRCGQNLCIVIVSLTWGVMRSFGRVSVLFSMSGASKPTTPSQGDYTQTHTVT